MRTPGVIQRLSQFELLILGIKTRVGYISANNAPIVKRTSEMDSAHKTTPIANLNRKIRTTFYRPYIFSSCLVMLPYSVTGRTLV